MYIFKTPSCTTHFTDLLVTSFGFSIKPSSFVYGCKFFVWPFLMNRSDDGLIEKPKLVTRRFVNCVVHDSVLIIYV